MEKKKFNDGIHTISIDDYHASQGISRSALWEFKRSAHHFYYKYLSENPTSSSDSAALAFGNLVHTMVLEPDKLLDEFVVKPDVDRRTNAGKLAFNQFTATIAGRIPVTNEQILQATAIKNAVYSNDFCKDLLVNCEVEKSIYWTDDFTGIQCKARPDAWKNNVVIDLKTTNDASYNSFQRSAFNYGYFLQAGMIYEALASINIELEVFTIIAVEKEPPYAIGVYALDNEAIDFGVKQFHRLLQEFSLCEDKQSWPAYGFNVLSIPKFANYETPTEYEHE